MKDVTIELTLLRCRSLDKEQVVRLAEVVFDDGFTLLQNVGGKMRKIESKGQIPGLVDGHYTESKIDGQSRRAKKWSVAFPAFPGVLAGFNNATMEAGQFSPGNNRIVISGLVDFEFKDQRSYVAPFAETLRRLAISFYPIARPDVTMVDDGEKVIIKPSDVSRAQISAVGWVNILGPPYVDRYGRDFLLGIPGHETSSLKDGGVYHQLAKTFVTESASEAKAIRGAVTEYFVKHDMKVTCRAPYPAPN